MQITNITVIFGAPCSAKEKDNVLDGAGLETFVDDSVSVGLVPPFCGFPAELGAVDGVDGETDDEKVFTGRPVETGVAGFVVSNFLAFSSALIFSES